MNKNCKKHNIEKKRLPSGQTRCPKCLTEAVQKRREKVKRLAIQYKGGKCECCGITGCNAIFDFHHTDPSKKDFSISNKGYTRSWDKVKEELDKCQLLCANCHRELHSC